MNKSVKEDIIKQLTEFKVILEQMQFRIHDQKEKLYPVKDKLYSENPMHVNKYGMKVKYADPLETIEKIIKNGDKYLNKEIKQLEKAIKEMQIVVFESDLKSNGE